ncbi:hypothetical protein A9Q99_17210 [Gammaproteobacteria bacterium 45_16_T64]|nr:hypothetical protein A9Q99_17210 [Gammaproteobacteria bacterium 45_16_T64]
MHIEVVHGSVIDAQSGAIMLTVDGASQGLEGNIARAFSRKYPDAWEELEYDIEYPMSLGVARMYAIDHELECPFSHCVVASTLNHIDTLSDLEKIQVISTALNSTLALASSKRLGSVCSGILSGGWRLEIEEAFSAMVRVYQSFVSGRPASSVLKIYILGDKEFKSIGSFIEKHYQVELNDGDFYRIGCS